MGGLCAAAGVMRAKQTAALVLLCPCRWTSGRLCPDPYLPLPVPLLVGNEDTAALIAVQGMCQAGCCSAPLCPCKCCSNGVPGRPLPWPSYALAGTLSQCALSYACAPAGVMGAKQTAALIPLCHNIFLSKVDVHATLQQESCSLLITAEASTTSETGTASSLWGSEGATLCMWAHWLPAEGSQQHPHCSDVMHGICDWSLFCCCT